MHILHKLCLILRDPVKAAGIFGCEAGVGAKGCQCQVGVLTELLLQGTGVVPGVLCVVTESGLQRLIVVEVTRSAGCFES